MQSRRLAASPDPTQERSAARHRGAGELSLRIEPYSAALAALIETFRLETGVGIEKPKVVRETPSLSAAEIIQLESARMSAASHFAGKDSTGGSRCRV